MRRQRSTKIIATLGSSTASAQEIRRLFEAGADAFCLDMRYGTQSDHLERYLMVREMEREMKRPVAVIMDLQGEKFRIGVFRHAGVELIPGQQFSLDLSAALGDHSRVNFPYPEIYSKQRVDGVLLLDNGAIKLRIESVSDSAIVTRVEIGGFLHDSGDILVPHRQAPVGTLAAKDAEDLEFGLSICVDWIALANVQSAQDVLALRNRIRKEGGPRVMAKIENPLSSDRLEEIVDAADAVMICRAQLGAELDAEEVPIAQRRIVSACRVRARPVILASQMLDSMTHDPSPTRAETSDVASGIVDGVDAMVLSAETASGKYPVQAVEVMDRVARRVESDPAYVSNLKAHVPVPEIPAPGDAITAAVRTAADLLPLSFSAVYTVSGSICLAVAGARPRSPILGLSPSVATVRMLSLVWGVHSVKTGAARSVEEMVERARAAACTEGFAEPGRAFIMVAGIPAGSAESAESANLMQIASA